MNRRLHPLVGIVGLFMLLAAACGPAAPPPAPTPPPPKPAATTAPAAPPATAPTAAPAAAAAPKPAQADLSVVTLAAPPNMNFVPIYVGIDKGIFLKYGIDAKLKIFQSGTEAMKALQVGDIQFGFSATANFLPAREGGIPAMIVAYVLGDQTTARSDKQLAIMAAPGTGIEAGKPATLVGKRVGTQIGQTPHDYLRLVLKQAGVDESKVQVLNVPQGDTVALLQAKTLDAIAGLEPYNSMAVVQVPNVVVVTRGGGYMGYIAPLVTMADTIEKKPDVTQKVVTGLAAASYFVRQNPDESAEIMTRYLPGLTADVAKVAMRNVPFDPRITKQTYETFAEVNQQLLDLKKIKAPVDFRVATVTKFIEQTQKEYPELFADLKPAP